MTRSAATITSATENQQITLDKGAVFHRLPPARSRSVECDRHIARARQSLAGM
ncbi:MAG: hypothetical protein JJU07_06190 [Natronohydrobacter sp.]|nr:hypothetical protein [Natronohydrobacter sp.]